MQDSERQQRGASVAWLPGVILIVIGTLALTAQFVDSDWIGLLVLPAIGAGFLAGGISSRRAGFMVPAGILLGLGAGVILEEAAFQNAPGDADAGIILLCFAGGWVLVALLTRYLTDTAYWWALIPGGFMGLLAVIFIVDAYASRSGLWRALGTWWPLLPVAVGAWLIYRSTRRSLD